MNSRRGEQTWQDRVPLRERQMEYLAFHKGYTNSLAWGLFSVGTITAHSSALAIGAYQRFLESIYVSTAHAQVFVTVLAMCVLIGRHLFIDSRYRREYGIVLPRS